MLLPAGTENPRYATGQRGLLTDAVRDATVPEEVEALDDLGDSSRFVVKHASCRAAHVGVERVAVDEVRRLAM